ncbi:helix-turn-helix domain-containing protein [Vreelandella titanicae]|uniref:helix-turn-helix domain-containing protein n=1 Tax=Vreelandella titanicae TaxID=664683 RepID=UPI003D06A957|tara:strand:+ start:7370 stop:7693 length:324 start_codon:yes stop_codon:yes gene_type:complete
MKVLVTYHEAAEMLSVSHWTVRQMVREGRLNATGEGKGRRVTMGSILRLGEMDARAFEEASHTVSSVQKQERGVRHHVQGNVRSKGANKATSPAERELDELLVKRRS